MATPGFNYIFENIPGMVCPAADYAALDGASDTTALAQKFFRARQFRLVYSVSAGPESTSGDVTLPFNSGDIYSANQDPADRWQMTDYRPYKDAANSTSDTNAPYITNLDADIDLDGVMFAMNIAQYTNGVFKFLPWMQICLGGTADPIVIASRYQPQFETYYQIGTMAILGLTIPVWVSRGREPDSWSMEVDDTIADAYWVDFSVGNLPPN